MNKLLSQDEVDSLLKGLDTGDVDLDEDDRTISDDIEPFDWAANGLNIRGNMPMLEVVNSKLGQKLRISISNSLRKMVEITPNPLETMKYGDFQKSLPVPTSMYLFKIEPLRGMGIMIIESRLVFSLIEAYFGGKMAGTTKIEGREFTSIEKKIIEKVVQMALAHLTEAWEEICPIKTEFIRSESNPLVVNILPCEELLVLTKFEIEMNKPLGNIILCVPYASYQPIRHKLAGGYRIEEEQKADKHWISGLEKRLWEIELDLSVLLGKTSLRVKDFLNLRTGDIIVLDNDSADPLFANIEGIPIFEGFVGQHKNRKVYKVEQPINKQTQ